MGIVIPSFAQLSESSLKLTKNPPPLRLKHPNYLNLIRNLIKEVSLSRKMLRKILSYVIISYVRLPAGSSDQKSQELKSIAL
jgi:hypothetical protein